jgi:L-rhamnose isomerase/sugar isomerase
MAEYVERHRAVWPEMLQAIADAGRRNYSLFLRDDGLLVGYYETDDDLIVGAADPFQLFRILYEVVRGGGYGTDAGVAFMLDQCHNIEDKIPGQIRSVLNVQEMTARALLVDGEALAAAQAAGDVLAANGILMDAFYTDVRGGLAAYRESRGLPADPMAAYAASGYGSSIAASRVGGAQAGWGA